jgi:glycosyltransferase involved in cell wall biosynthesis
MAVRHAFVVPAHGHAPWLERCLRSLLTQNQPSPVLVTTSTPTPQIVAVARTCGVPVEINKQASGIAGDWNFAYDRADADWVTLAHQDDIYEPGYAQACLEAADQSRNPLLVFTAAVESVSDSSRTSSNTRIKALLAELAFLGRRAIDDQWSRRLLLGFGNPIPCSSVMLRKSRLPGFRFPTGWYSNLDWRAWLDLAEHEGAFVYVRRPLVRRTLHPDAATSRFLTARADEDNRMFAELWPRPMASVLKTLYRASRRPYASFSKQPPGLGRNRT